MWALGIWLVLAGQQFSDIPKGHWSSGAVTNVTARGYMNGDPKGAFNGDKPLTRYEFAVALDRFVRDVQAGLAAAPKPYAPKKGAKPATKPAVKPKSKPGSSPKTISPGALGASASLLGVTPGADVSRADLVLPLGAKRPVPRPPTTAPATPQVTHPPVKPAPKAVDVRVGVAPNHWAYKSLRHLYDGKYLPPKSPIFLASSRTLTARQAGTAMGQIAVRLVDLRSDPSEPHED